MNLADEQKQWIVQEVLRRLQGAAAVESPARDSTTVEPGDAAQGEAHLDQPVITLQDISALPSTITALAVRARALITPAAQDELQQRGLRVRRERPEPKGAAAALPTVLIGIAECESDLGSLVAALASRGIGAQPLARVGLKDVVAELCLDVARGGRPGVLFTNKPYVAACLANRHPGVRAAWACDDAGVRRAIDELAANLLVVDPAGRGHWELQRMVTHFCLAPRSDERVGASHWVDSI
jgi:hypothetical protein